jgi:cell division protein FtsN
LQQRKFWWVLGIAVFSAVLVMTTTSCSTISSSKLAPDVSQSSESSATPSSAPVPTRPLKGTPIPAAVDTSYASTKSLPSMGFWAVWGPTSRAEAAVRPAAEELIAEGFPAGIVYTPEWGGLSGSPWYIVCIGPYSSRAVATKALTAAQSRGHKGFRVKFSGATTMDLGAGWVRGGAHP